MGNENQSIDWEAKYRDLWDNGFQSVGERWRAVELAVKLAAPGDLDGIIRIAKDINAYVSGANNVD